MKKQIIAVLAAVAVAGGIAQADVLDQNVVIGTPVLVDLNGTITGNNGAKVKLQAIPLTFAQTSFSTSSGGPTTTVTRAWLASSITTTTVVDIVGTTTNDVTYVTALGGTIFQSPDDTGVFIAKGNSGGYANVFNQTDGSTNSAGPITAVLYVDAKLRVNRNTGEPSLNSAKVYGIWQAAQGIISGTLKPSKVN